MSHHKVILGFIADFGSFLVCHLYFELDVALNTNECWTLKTVSMFVVFIRIRKTIRKMWQPFQHLIKTCFGSVTQKWCITTINIVRSNHCQRKLCSWNPIYSSFTGNPSLKNCSKSCLEFRNIHQLLLLCNLKDVKCTQYVDSCVTLRNSINDMGLWKCVLFLTLLLNM